MFIAYIAVALLAAVANGYAATLDFLRHQKLEDGRLASVRHLAREISKRVWNRGNIGAFRQIVGR